MLPCRAGGLFAELVVAVYGTERGCRAARVDRRWLRKSLLSTWGDRRDRVASAKSCVGLGVLNHCLHEVVADVVCLDSAVNA